MPAPLRYCLCTTEEQYRKAMQQAGKDYPTPFVNEGAHATTHYLPAGKDRPKSLCIVCIKCDPNCDKIAHFALLVHECSHILRYMLQEWGETEPGDEMMAYTIQEISLNLMDDLNMYFEQNPDAYLHDRKHHQARRNVVRRRGRNNAKRT